MFSRTFAFSSNVWREKKNNNKNSIFFVRAKSENKYNWKTWFSYCPNVFVAYKQTKKIHFIHSFLCDWLDKQKQHYIAAFPLDIRHDGNSFPARRTAFWLARTLCCACVNAWEVRYPVSSVKWKWGCSCGCPGHVLSDLTAPKAWIPWLQPCVTTLSPILHSKVVWFRGL